MTIIEAAAYVNAQTACAFAEIEGMKAENEQRARQGHAPAWDYDAFLSIPDKYGIGHNAVLTTFANAFPS